jgi:hypothetical protein
MGDLPTRERAAFKSTPSWSGEVAEGRGGCLSNPQSQSRIFRLWALSISFPLVASRETISNIEPYFFNQKDIVTK